MGCDVCAKPGRYRASHRQSIITASVDKQVYILDYTTGEVCRPFLHSRFTR